MRRVHVQTLACFLVMAAIFGGCGKGPAAKLRPGEQDPHRRYNVVLIVSDALRYDLPGCNGGVALTPNIDALAASGTRFQQAHSAAPWTMPSAVAMGTGVHAEVFRTKEDGPVAGRANYRVPADFQTLPSVLENLGYDLVLNAYNPHAWLAGNFQGFRRVESESGQNAPKLQNAAALADLSRVLPFKKRSPLHQRLSGFLTFLQSAPKETPFFAINWFDDPHAPYSPPPRFIRGELPPRRDLARRYRFYSRQTNMHLFDNFAKASLSPAEIQYFQQLYQGEVESVDERVGLILGMLDARGLRDNTIIIFTADHGEAFNEHGTFEHGRTYYEELVHVPLIISGPGIPQAAVVNTPVSTVDLMPTLQRLLGVAGQDEDLHQGFLAALKGQEWTPGPLFFDSASNLADNDCRDAVLDGSFKLITHLSAEGVELYDLQADPGEKTNLAAHQTDRVESLTHMLTEFRQACSLQRAELEAKGAATTDSTSETERQEILKKLKSLGYVN